MGCFTVLNGKKKKKNKPNRSISFSINHTNNAQQHSPTALPEPQTQPRSLHSAPPSFRTRVKPLQSGTSEQDKFVSNDHTEQDPKSRPALCNKEYSSPNPQPLPLPSPSIALRTTMSFKSNNSSNLDMSGPLPLPPAVPSTNKGAALVNFSLEEISSACHNFSPDRCMSEGLSSVFYRASFEDSSGSKKLEATVTRLHPSNQGFKEFVSEVHTLASLQHPFLCKLIGFHAVEGSAQRMLVYERLYHGSLDRLLYGRSDGPPIDWNSRVKVALCAAQGLTFLHEEGPFQAMFYEFSTANIQINKDFSAKLSGYGCISHVSQTDISNSSAAIAANLSVETLNGGLLTPKSNVWSFGIVLLELLTGRKNLDSNYPKEERNLVKWTRPYLSDECRLSLIMDTQLKGRFPAKAARAMADIAQKCLQTDPSGRPTMRAIVDRLKSIQDMKFASRFPLQEPNLVGGKHMSRSASLNGIIHPIPSSSFAPPHKAYHALPLAAVPSSSSTKQAFEDVDLQEGKRSSSSSSTFRRSSVEET